VDESSDDDDDDDPAQLLLQPRQRDTERTANHVTPPTAVDYFRSRAAAHATHCTSGYVACTAEASPHWPSQPENN